MTPSRAGVSGRRQFPTNVDNFAASHRDRGCCAALTPPPPERRRCETAASAQVCSATEVASVACTPHQAFVERIAGPRTISHPSSHRPYRIPIHAHTTSGGRTRPG